MRFVPGLPDEPADAGGRVCGIFQGAQRQKVRAVRKMAEREGFAPNNLQPIDLYETRKLTKSFSVANTWFNIKMSQSSCLLIRKI